MPLDLALRCFFVFYYLLYKLYAKSTILQTPVTTAGLFFDVHTAAPRNQGLRMETGSQHTYFRERIVGKGGLRRKNTPEKQKKTATKPQGQESKGRL
jgi:hypothetical protein